MLILPLPAEEITRNADSDRLPKGGARSQRTRDQVLERKRQDGIRSWKREIKKVDLERAGCDGGGRVAFK